MTDAKAEPADQPPHPPNLNAAPVADGHRFDEGALHAWMRANVAGYQGPMEVRRFQGGRSNPTYQLITPSRHYVMRRKPLGRLLPSAHAVDREYKVITALHPIGFPSPRGYGLCTDDSVIGSMFYVMEMIEGRIFWDLQLPGLDPAERHALYMAKLKTLADLHNVDYEAAGLGDLGRPGNYMARQIDRWTKQYKLSEGAPVDEMERLIAWLPQSVPQQTRTTIVHGDFRLDNMVFHPTKPRVIAVLDWELGTLGEPLADFAYLLMQWVNGPLAAISDLRAHGIPTLDEYTAEYCRLTKRDALPELSWYFAYSLFRQAAIIQGVVGRAQAGTANSEDAAAMAPRVAALAKVSWDFAHRAGAS